MEIAWCSSSPATVPPPLARSTRLRTLLRREGLTGILRRLPNRIAIDSFGAARVIVLENTLVASAMEANSPPDHFTEAERLGRLVPDQHPDKHATCYVIRGRGLVVISSCGHVG